MQRLNIKQILLEQKEEISRIIGNKKLIHREVEKKAKKSLSNNLIKVIIGVRRSGKSILAHQILIGKNYGYINFDDEKLINVKADDLNDLLEVSLEINSKFNYLLLDEVQNVTGWELFANRLQRQGYNLVVTGSNSKLLSKELATHLTGRHLTIELFPFSFREYLDYQGKVYSANDLYLTAKKAEIKSMLRKYIEQGGFPELFNIDLQKQYLQELYGKIVAKDVVSRHNIRYIQDIKEIALYCLTNFGARLNYAKLKNIFDIRSAHTVKNYIGFLEEAYILFQLQPFFYKLKNRIKGFKKVYGIDLGLIKSVTSEFSPNVGRIMENIILLELKRRREDIYFYQDYAGREVDFVVKAGLKIKQLIQSCYNLDSMNIRERELKSLLKAGAELGCNDFLVITWDTEATEKLQNKKIVFIPLWKWLLR